MSAVSARGIQTASFDIDDSSFRSPAEHSHQQSQSPLLDSVDIESEPHQAAIGSWIREICGWGTLAGFSIVAILSIVIGLLSHDQTSFIYKHQIFEVCDLPQNVTGGQPENCRVECLQPLLVANILFLAITFMVQGCRSEFCLVGATVFYGALKIIDAQTALAGFAATGNILIQCIFILVQGIQDSGVLDRIFLTLLGKPGSRFLALFRAQSLSAIMSAFLQQQTVTMAIAPTLEIWAPRVGLTQREILMPIAASGGAGNNMFLISSSVSLTAAQMMPRADLGQMDTVPGCVVLSVLTILHGSIFAGKLLGRAETRQQSEEVQDEESESHYVVVGERYIIEFEVDAGSMLIGRTPTQAGLASLPGVSLICEDRKKEQPLMAGDVLPISATAVGVKLFRSRAPGLFRKVSDRWRSTYTVGMRRHRRCLFEIGIGPESKFINASLPAEVPEAIFFCARRPGCDKIEGTLQVGDVLLVEAYEDFRDILEVRKNFAYVGLVPGSMPPRHGRSIDKWRGWSAAVLLLSVIALAMIDVIDISLLGLIAVFIAVMVNVVHRNAVLGTLNLPIYLTIAGGLGVSQAIKASGLADAVSKLVVVACDQFAGGSPIVMICALSLLTAILANLMSNTATVAIMCPVASAICESQHINFKTVALILIFSANAAYSTPFACSANLIISSLGPYSFMDYFRFGFPLQLMTLVAAPLVCGFMHGF